MAANVLLYFGQRISFGRASSVFEELNGSLMFLRCRSALECAEISPSSLLWIDLPRIEPILPGFQLPNHANSPEH
jgi:hypothetical protein